MERTTLDNLLRVRTPENISFQYRLAGPFQRACAFGLDLLISQITFVLFCVVMALLFSLLYGLAFSPLVREIGAVTSGLIFALAFLVWWFYGALMETWWNGQTYGKRIMRLRVLCVNGEAIDGVQAFLRNFFRLLDCFPLFGLVYVFGNDAFDSEYGAEFGRQALVPSFMFGLIVMSVSRRFQRVGDLVAGTIVVQEDRAIDAGLASFVDRRVGGLAELIPADLTVSASLARVLSMYTDRRRFLPYQRYNEIAGHLAEKLIAKSGLPPDTDHDLFLCALYWRTFVNTKPGEMSVAGDGEVNYGSDREVIEAFPDVSALRRGASAGGL